MIEVSSQRIREGSLSISFDEIITQYVKYLHDGQFKLLPSSVKEKIRTNLIKELNCIAKTAFQHELNAQTNHGEASIGSLVKKTTIELLKYDYSYLNEILERKAKHISKHISKIFDRFAEDRHKIAHNFNLNVNLNTLTIVDIDVNLGDEHNGEGTALVILSDGTKLIYKPRNCSITRSYNSFINWVNNKLQEELHTFGVLDCGDYGWLEFVDSNEISTEEGLQEYYYKAGMLLAVTYLLGSKDYHNENIIASAKGPVIIDHETIIQPFLKDSFSNSWYKGYGIPSFSVLESSLIAEPDKEIPANMIGYGLKGYSTETVIWKNVPKYKGRYVFADQCKTNLISGFSNTYNMLMNSIDELKSNESPIASFVNNEVRFVWRPTYIYTKILRYLTKPSYLTSCEPYHLKLLELLSKLYKKDSMRQYLPLLDYEMKQMLSGDIPIFHLKSHDNYLEGNKKLNLFEYNSLENINHRINLLSVAHKKEQLAHIAKWLNK